MVIVVMMVMFFGAAHTGGERHICCFHTDALGLRYPIPYGGSASLCAIVEVMTHWSLLRLAMTLKAMQPSPRTWKAPGPVPSRLWHPNTGLCKHPRDAAIRKPS